MRPCASPCSSTAADLFLQHGFGNVSTRQIAAAAGTTPAMIHYYFGDKLGLYRAMIESAVQPLIDSVRRLEQAAGDEAPGLEAVMRAYMRMVAANPWFPALLIQEVLDAERADAGRIHRAIRGENGAGARCGAAARTRTGETARRPRSTVCRGSLLSLCVFPFVSLADHGSGARLPPGRRELDRFISHTAQLFREGVAARTETGNDQIRPGSHCPRCCSQPAARKERPVEVHGTVERDRLEIIAESNERIVEIVVHEGDHVPAGTVLVRQEAGIAQPRIDQSRAAVLEAQRRLADLEQGPRQREIDEARATLGGAESELQTAQRNIARVQTLVQRKLLSQSNLDQARASARLRASSA